MKGQEENRDGLFDELVRERLTDAEVRPPHKVWRAVRHDMGTVPARPVWRLATVAAALACVLVGGLRMSMRHHGSADIRDDHAQVLPLEKVAAPVTAQDDVTEMYAEAVRVKQTPAAPLKLLSAGAGEPVATEEIMVVDEEKVANAENVSVAVAANALSAARDDAAADVQEHAEPVGNMPVNEFSDPFAEEGEALRRIDRRAVATFSGLIGTNDNISASIVSRKMAVSGSDNSTKAISQSGESSYSIPLSLGLGVRFYMSQRWSFGTGVQYSMLNRTFDGTYSVRDANNVVIRKISAEVSNTQQYIGVPLALYYDFVQRNDMSIYAFGGAAFEKAVSNRYKISGAPDVMVKERKHGLQSSLAFGFGISYNLSEHIGLYLDPSLSYYFDCSQPVSIRTQQPLQLAFTAGLRFKL